MYEQELSNILNSLRALESRFLRSDTDDQLRLLHLIRPPTNGWYLKQKV